MSADVTFGEPSAAAPRSIDFSTSSQERTPMIKGYDYLAAPLNALRSGNPRLAIQQLEELAVVKPEIIETTYHLARAYQAAGDDQKARALLAEVADMGNHPFRAHAQAQLAKLGGPPASGNTGIVPPHVTEAIAEAAHNTGIVPPHVTEAAAEEAHNTGIVPPHVAEQVNAEVEPAAAVEAPVETASQDAAPAEAAAEQAAPAEAPKAKGKKGKAAPADGSGDPGQSAS